MSEFLRTVDLARSVGLSVQQVRNYQAWGFIPASARGENGYRLYSTLHLEALKTARSLIAGYSWPVALKLMQAVHRNDLPAVLTLLDSWHADLDRKRRQVVQTLEALTLLPEQGGLERENPHAPGLRVGEAAKQAGVRVSALHFWEQQELLHPKREKSSRYRSFDGQQMQRLRLVALLREVNYDFDVIRAVLSELESGRPARALEALTRRNDELNRISWLCAEATYNLYRYIQTYHQDCLNDLNLQS